MTTLRRKKNAKASCDGNIAPFRVVCSIERAVLPARILMILAFLLLLLFSTTLRSQTEVSGIISSDTTWILSGSPYIVIGNVLVNSGVTLTIEPEVSVKFNTDKSVQINGTLVARGTSESNITFTSNQSMQTPGDWGNIYFTDSSTDAVFDGSGNYISGSILEYSVLKYGGGDGTTGVIKVDAASPFINYCDIENNRGNGIFGSVDVLLKVENSNVINNEMSGIYISNIEGMLYVKNCMVNRNGQNGVAHWYESLSVLNTELANNSADGIYHYSRYETDGGVVEIVDNSITQNGGYGINIHQESFNCSFFIKNNSIINNGAGGIRSKPDGGQGPGSMMSGNIIAHNGGDGIYSQTWGMETKLEKNIVAENAGYGIYGEFYQTGTPGIIRNNIVTGNRDGVYAFSYSYWNTFSYDDSTIISNNTVYRNGTNGINCYGAADVDHNTIFFNNALGDNIPVIYFSEGYHAINHNTIVDKGQAYNLYNNNPSNSPTTNAENNWWSTTSDSVIQAKIYDWNDDASLSIVDYSPYLTSPDTSAPISPPFTVVKSAVIANGDVCDSRAGIIMTGNPTTHGARVTSDK